jgi:mRNA degradation ribonuclease J1/J2
LVVSSCSLRSGPNWPRMPYLMQSDAIRRNHMQSYAMQAVAIICTHMHSDAIGRNQTAIIPVG